MTNLPPIIWRSSFAVSAICLTILVPEKGFAGDSFAPAPKPTLDQAHCDSLGDGFIAVAGSSACVKISGYVSAGTGVSAMGGESGPGAAPFAAKANVGMDSQTAVSGKAQFESRLGPGRLYVQVGHDSQ